MAVDIIPYTTYSGGISDFIRSGIANSFAFARSVDVRTDINNITVLPRTIKESGSVIVDLPKWAETYNPDLTTYIYGGAGTIYSRTSAAVYANLRTVNDSHGNGLVYSAEDDFLYYALDKVIGRYGPLSSSSPTFVDDFFGSQGGVPLNTASIDYEASSSQYSSRADTASLSITGNISIDIQIKPESLPTVGNQMVLMSKWDESGVLRSYKFDINAASGYFGDGSDGTLTISVNTTDAPIDSTCTGTSGNFSLSATNASFATGQIVLIHQSIGTNAGQWERNTIASYTTGTITLVNALMGTYTSGAQVLVLKQYTNVTVNSGITWSAKDYNRSSGVGGILSFVCNGTFTNNGTIDASGDSAVGQTVGAGAGFRGGATPGTEPGNTGDGTSGLATQTSSANGNGGGGAYGNSGAGGGGNGTAGAVGNTGGAGGGLFNTPGSGGNASGTADLTSMTFGGGGGSSWEGTNGAGGCGGGIVFISATTLTLVSGSLINVNGGDGGNSLQRGGGGGGAGGSVLMKAQTATLGTNLISASGGAGGTGVNPPDNATGGTGGQGRIVLDYYTSYTGTTTPTINPIQDSSLVTNTSYQLRLSVSSTGSNSEVLAQVANIQQDAWQQVGVAWTASTSTAIFYLNGMPIGTRTGTLTSIHNNTSTFQLAMSKNGAGTPANFYDGLMDEARLFNVVRNDADMNYGLNQQIPVNTAGLVAYYKLNGDVTDATSNSNDLTSSGSPVFVTDVPFPSPTTRLDIDQSGGGTGDTYAVPTAILETSVNKLSFTPGKDPQKSIQFNVANIGTGTWTVTIHDSFNNVMATSIVTNANMHTGNYEFIYSLVWHPLTNFTNTYHAHITCTSGSPTVVSSSHDDLSTAQFVTYFQFLDTNTAWHAMGRLLQFWIVCNNHYIGKYEASLYEPNKIALGAIWNAHCLADWREFKAMGCIRGNSVTDFDQGRIYFWDGIAPTFNFYIDVPEGGINAMIGSRGRLFVWAGYKNQLLVYEGGDSAQKLKDLPKMENDKSSEIYPQAITMWQSLLRYGVAAGGDSTAIQKGVYTYGSTNLRYPEILTYDYPISTGTLSGTSTKVSLVFVVAKKLMIGWQDGISYGVDYVDTSNAPFISSMIQFLVDDGGLVTKEEEALEVVASFDALASDQSIQLGYALEGSSSFTINPDLTTTGDTLSRMIIENGRYHEVQVQLNITAATTSPTIKGLTFVKDPLKGEERY